MAANILNSERAVRMSVFIVRAFVKLRETAQGYKELAQRSLNWKQKWEHTTRP